RAYRLGQVPGEVADLVAREALGERLQRRADRADPVVLAGQLRVALDLGQELVVIQRHRDLLLVGRLPLMGRPPRPWEHRLALDWQRRPAAMSGTRDRQPRC